MSRNNIWTVVKSGPQVHAQYGPAFGKGGPGRCMHCMDSYEEAPDEIELIDAVFLYINRVCAGHVTYS